MALPNLTAPSGKIIDLAPLANEGAERALLGALIADARRIIDVRAILSASDMFFLRHGHILRAVYALHDAGGAAVDFVTVAHQLKADGHYDDVGGAVYLTELMSAAINPSAAEYYAKLIIESAARRRLLEVVDKIKAAAINPTSNLDILRADLESAISSYTTRDQGDVEDMEMASALALERIRASALLPAGVSGLSTGFRDLDDVLDGLQPRTLNIVAARPGMGKSALAHIIALKVAMRGQAVYIASQEMTRGQVFDRLISIMTGLDGRLVRRGLRPGGMTADQHARYQQAAVALGKLPIYIDDVTNISTAFIEARVERIARRRQRPALIIEDYLQLMTPVRPEDTRQLAVSSIARGLKNLASILDIPILAAAQINREVENRADKRPQLSDLRESGEIEQAADVVMFIYRDVVYNEATPYPKRADVIVSKNRHDRVGVVTMGFDSDCTRFGSAAVQHIDLGAL